MSRFGKHIQKMPVGQSVALLEQLSNSFQSIFLTQLPRKRKKRKHNHRESGLESISDNFKAALLCGVDVFHLVLLSTPLTVWTSDGLHKEKAMKTLLGIQRDVILPLMIAAKDIVSHTVGSSVLCLASHFHFIYIVNFFPDHVTYKCTLHELYSTRPSALHINYYASTTVCPSH